MTRHDRTTANEERRDAYTLPRWEHARRQRRLLERRVRAVRRALLAGGVIGTVGFSAIAGYETKLASGAGSAARSAEPATQTPATLNGVEFFAKQSSAALPPTATAAVTATAPPTARATATPSPTATAAATATEATATETPTATATATEPPTATATAVPTDTSSSLSAPAPQPHSRTHSSG